MPKIMETTNYGMFDHHENNRVVDANTQKLCRSMQKHGWVDAFPMHCVKNGKGKLKIKGGHHRFSAAVRLGIPVKYVVSSDEMTLFEVERSTTNWSIRDFVVSKCNAGDRDCLEVMAYTEKTGIAIGLSLSMFWGDAAGSGNASTAIKEDRFKVRNRQHPMQVAAVVDAMRTAGVKFAANSFLVQAVSKVLLVPEVDLQQFLRQIRNHHEVIEKQPHLQGYLSMLEMLYNRARKKKKFPLVYRVQEVSSERCAAGLKRG